MKVSLTPEQLLPIINSYIKSSYKGYSWNKKGDLYVFGNQKGDIIIEYNQHFTGNPNILYIDENFYDGIKRFIPLDRERLYEALAKWTENELNLRVGIILPSNILRFLRI